MGIGFTAFIAVLFLIFITSSLRIMREYERGVVFTLGRYTGCKGPGVVILLPMIQQMVRVDLRVRTIDVPSQDIISKDNIPVQVNAVLYYRVVAPEKSINNVADFMRATSELGQTTLREVLGKHDFDELLSERDKLSTAIRELIDTQADQWGIKVSSVALKRIDVTETMTRSIARQAEAERERRAKVISAEGEMQAADRLVEAARKLALEPNAMQLRYLSALQDIANDKTNTILLPLPLDMIKKLS